MAQISALLLVQSGAGQRFKGISVNLYQIQLTMQNVYANCTLLAYGMECGWISPTTKILQSAESPTGESVSDNTLSWITSSMSVGAIFGASIYTFITDKYGRKIGVIFITIPQTISWIIRLYYTSTTGLIIARVLAGLSAGGSFSVIPMYVKEISQDDIRGILGSFVVVSQTMGVLFMYIIGAYLSYYTVIFIAVTLPIVVSILFIKAPETPAFLVKERKYDKASETVAHLRSLDIDDIIVKNIVECMKNEELHFKSLPKITYASILKERSWRRGLLLILTTFFFHALNGVYSIMTYASTILISTGVKFQINPEIQTFSFPLFMSIGSLLLATCVEKYGRKPLLVAAFFIVACSMAVIAVLTMLQDKGWNIPSWLPVTTIILVVTVYGAGVSPLPYIIMTEMFNFQIRAKVMGIVVTFAWIMATILVSIHSPLTTYLGPHAPFIFYAIINFLGSLFTLLYIPETKAKTEEEITLILSKKHIFKNQET